MARGRCRGSTLPKGRLPRRVQDIVAVRSDRDAHVKGLIVHTSQEFSENVLTRSAVPTSSNLPGFAFTLLSLADGSRCAVKTLTRQPDGTIDSSEYDNGFEWWFKPFNIGADFDKHARLLRRYAQIDRVIMCMGDPKSGIDFNLYHQRLWARTTHPRTRWSRSHGHGCRSTSTTRLSLRGSERRDGMSKARSMSATTCFPKIPRLHDGRVAVGPHWLARPGAAALPMWFLLDRPYELPALKAWTLGLKAVAGVGDSAVCQAGQPIYTGRARFVGMDDPIPPNSGRRW